MPIYKDKDGNVIQNTAKGPYPKPQVEPVSIGVIKATVRKSSYTDTNYKTELNATNNGTWRDWTAGQAWIARIDTEDVNEGGTNLVRIRYIVYCCEYGWKSVAPQLGYYHLDGGDPKVFTDSSGNPYLGCLDNSGAKLASASNMILKEWEIKRPIAFSTLGF